MLKITDNLIDEELNITNFDVKAGKYEAKIFFEKNITEEDLENLRKEQEKLISSIKRRENLLSNENYVSRAPEAIVNKEREDLAKEKLQLEMINSKLN